MLTFPLHIKKLIKHSLQPSGCNGTLVIIKSANNILLDSQHGFSEKLSTVTQLISSCHYWTTTIPSPGKDKVIILDVSKAFDKVLHHRFSVKLLYYRINEPNLSCINDFLRNSVKDIFVNGSHSTCGNVVS